jgi:hypothetical protein
MEASKRATVYFDAAIHQAVRLKAAAADRSISDMVNDAVKVASAELPKLRRRRAAHFDR